MKKRNLQKIFAAFMATAMAVSTAACSSKPADEKPADDKKEDTTVTSTPAKDDGKKEDTTDTTPVDTGDQGEEIDDIAVLTHSDGSPIDLGGMEIIIRDWWSSGEEAEPTNDYDEARLEWLDYIQSTYNFTIKSMAISDWGSAPQDFVDYATTGGDENYLFVLRADPAIVSAMNNNLMYDLATLDCLDFSEPFFQRNKLHVQYAKGEHIYGMAAGYSEARTGVFFNKQVLTDAGIDPESLYDAQANGTWTWDMFDELCAKVQRDLDSDGVDDIYGLTINESVMTDQAVFSNGGSYIDRDASGKFSCNLECPETIDALNWCVDMYTKYDNHDPEGAAWDYYKEEFLSGKVAFMPDQAYCCSAGNFLVDAADFEIGFVMFPKGRSEKGCYTNVWDNNICAIPACYDAEKAWNIAFAWKLYNTAPAGYEDYINLSNYRSAGCVDERAISETIVNMMQPEYGQIAFHGLVPSLATGEQLTWSVGPNADVTSLVEGIRDTWKSYCDIANQ